MGSLREAADPQRAVGGDPEGTVDPVHRRQLIGGEVGGECGPVTLADVVEGVVPDRVGRAVVLQQRGPGLQPDLHPLRVEGDLIGLEPVEAARGDLLLGEEAGDHDE